MQVSSAGDGGWGRGGVKEGRGKEEREEVLSKLHGINSHTCILVMVCSAPSARCLNGTAYSAFYRSMPASGTSFRDPSIDPTECFFPPS